MKALFVLLCFWATTAQALPDAVRQDTSWQRRGSGELTWFGFPVYRATLWTHRGPDISPPLALVLEYRRSISGARIARTSVEEMRRLGASETALARWSEAMVALFPDVSDGDRLTGLHLADGRARFYFREHLLGEIADPVFAEFFFAIWLDPRTRAPEVRDALLRPPR